MLAEYVVFSCILAIGATLVTVGFGSYFYAIAAAKCIKENLSVIDKMSRSKNERKMIWEPLIELIKFHSRVKQLSCSIAKCVLHKNQ